MGEEQNLDSSPPSTTGEQNLRRIIDEINSLSTLSNTIRVFSVKWQLIRKKLDELTTFLVAAEVPHGHYSNHTAVSPLSDTFTGISNTVMECHNLATRCINVSFSGKLLMQSDLDKVISKLDSITETLSSIFRSSGVVTGDLALVVSKPPCGAGREDMKFYVKDLLTRVKIGDTQMKKQGLVSLNEVILEDEKKYVKIVVECNDFVILLANCLDSIDVGIQEESAFAIAKIAGFELNRGVLVVSGVIPPLIRVVEKYSSLRCKEFAIRSLEKLTENGENAWAISAHGGVTALLNLCSNDLNDVELIGPSFRVLRNLVGVEEIKRFMIENGAISTCIKLIKNKDEMGQISGVEFLQSLASGDDDVRLAIKEGGIRCLVRLIEPRSNASFKSRETSLRAIENLCFSSIEHVKLLINYGFIDQLLYFLRKGDPSIQELAFKSACRLCGTSEDARKTMGDCGFMAEFVKFLEAKSYEIREMAAEALASMVIVPKNRKKFANDDRNIGLILQLIDPKEGNSGNFKFLLSILLSLSNCNHARKKISHCGYVNNIEKLADAGVSDAKKIVRKLSTNRFKNMLNGIWHS